MANRQRYSRKEKAALFQKIGIICIILVIIGVAATVTSVVIDQRKIVRSDEAETTTEEIRNIVEINGVKCTPKQNIKTYLFMGIDADGKVQAADEENLPGQCDVLELLVVDTEKDEYTLLPINRDTMTDVKSLSLDGTYLATGEVQIALAHANGDGLEMSCENAVDAVSNLLYGQEIDEYLSLNMSAIGMLNNLVGGVTVTIEDDFSAEDPTMVEGETITLNDEQAEHFVRGRMGVGDGSNLSRMRRQKVYMTAFKANVMQKCAEDSSFPLQIYDGLGEYMVTSLSGNQFGKLAKVLLEDTAKDTLEIEGTAAVGYLDFNEFTVDEDSLADVVIQLFYDRI